MGRLVDDATLKRWREWDVLDVLQTLGCYAKLDASFRPIKSSKTVRYHVNANSQDWELLITGPKFWDTREGRGGGGAIDLVMHLYGVDFKQALLKLRAATLGELSATDGKSNPESPDIAWTVTPGGRDGTP